MLGFKRKSFVISILVLIVIFGVAVYVFLNKNHSDNPYGKANLSPETIALLDNPLYQNIILPNQLQKQLQQEGDCFVYFFSPTCEYCIIATPALLNAAATKMIDMKMYNLKEFEQGWKDFRLEYMPTIVHFKNGKEIKRLVGSYDEETYVLWFTMGNIE